ncbi:hypothetical protein [Kumtagia ephedrae]|uniref:hypothetical protein n=1 Tax=Kumtagia ephedrae TaxID=2116701 RepID=UPI0014041DA4|nr:hypothetical protein [Mesorhizobium ephedrae]
MIRLVVIATVLALLALLLVKLAGVLRRANVDWGGIAFICGFVALAFYLRHVTGMG